MKKILNYVLYILMVCIFVQSLVSCGVVIIAASASEASSNRKNMQDIKIGMEKAQVIKIMGNPHKIEAYPIEGKQISVLFYVTEGRRPFLGLDDSNFTPLILENDILTGWGRVHFEHITKKTTGKE
jgi:uncharacterized protein YxeA